MNKSIYFLAAIILIAFYFFNEKKVTIKNHPLAQQQLAVQSNYKDNLVGVYQSNNNDNSKELILDSTYTYTYSIQKNNQRVLLTGTWELSYKNDVQHLILHSPIQENAIIHNNLITNVEERKIKVIQEGLLDIEFREVFTKINIPSTRLAFCE